MSITASDGTPAVGTPPIEREYFVERVGEAAVVQVYADGFEELSLREKTLVWHLYLAAIAGRDIFYDQRYEHNLDVRDLLEAILVHVDETMVDAGVLDEIRQYTKLFWINTGPYNNLTARKFVLRCEPSAVATAARAAAARGAPLPIRAGESLDELLGRLAPVLFDPTMDPSVTQKTPPAGLDILEASANNLYSGVTMADLDGFREVHPINSRLVKRNGELVEEVYRAGGKYGAAIEAIAGHLEAAISYAPPAMADALRALIRVYRTGDDRDREAYDIAWVNDRESPVDTINGFVEVYLDARGIKGAWEALVFYVNRTKTAQIRTIAEHAQWFEDRMPWEARFRKPVAVGISARAIDVVIETGDSGPMTPIGINLPNDQAVRERYGSKSVSLSNINEAYDRSTPPELRSEFSWTREEADRAHRWSAFAGELTTNLHEVIGHGSGRVEAHLNGSPQTVLREQYSALEESRADLVALYFIADPKLVELGIMDGADHAEIVHAEYEGYARNALVQLRRVREGNELEEDHMRNRQMIVHWLMDRTGAIERRQRDGKSYYALTDVDAFRAGVAELLAEVQRIKSQGDYAAARDLFDRYGVHFDPELRDEIVERVDRLNLPSYTAFVMPRLTPVVDASGAIRNVEISYPRDLTAQMLEYSAATRATRR
jgi:dipeptidyl-peptidase III